MFSRINLVTVENCERIPTLIESCYKDIAIVEHFEGNKKCLKIMEFTQEYEDCSV